MRLSWTTNATEKCTQIVALHFFQLNPHTLSDCTDWAVLVLLWHTYLLQIVDALLFVELNGAILGYFSSVVSSQDTVIRIGAACHNILQHINVSFHGRQMSCNKNTALSKLWRIVSQYSQQIIFNAIFFRLFKFLDFFNKYLQNKTPGYYRDIFRPLNLFKIIFWWKNGILQPNFIFIWVEKKFQKKPWISIRKFII